MNTSIDVAVIGSINLDIVVRVDRIPAPGETVHGKDVREFPGGKGLNQAVAAARSGANTAFVSALGDDAAGDSLLDLIRAEKIEASRVLRSQDPTGRAYITVDAHAENSIVVISGANASVTGFAPEASVVLAQLEVPAATVTDAFVEAHSRGSVTVLNPAPASPLDPVLVANSDIVIPNQHELALVGGVDALLAGGVSTILVTLGADGVDIVSADGTRHIDPFTVSPVDTTGAGDAFCGAFAACLASGAELERAVEWGAAAGALATTVEGAVPGQPTRESIENLVLARRS